MTPHELQTGRGDAPEWHDAFMAAMDAIDCRDSFEHVQTVQANWERTIDEANAAGEITPRRVQDYRENIKVTLFFYKAGAAELAGQKHPAFDDFDNIEGTQ